MSHLEQSSNAPMTVCQDLLDLSVYSSATEYCQHLYNLGLQRKKSWGPETFARTFYRYVSVLVICMLRQIDGSIQDRVPNEQDHQPRTDKSQASHVGKSSLGENVALPRLLFVRVGIV